MTDADEFLSDAFAQLPTAKKPWVCMVCGKKFATLSEINAHMPDDVCPDGLPLNLETLSPAVHGYGGVIGDTSSGEWDVEFSDIHEATAFAKTYGEHGWKIELRDPISSLAQTVVLTIASKRH
jgi:hypothetical protein